MELESQMVVSHLIGAGKKKQEFSVRSASALNHQAIFLAPPQLLIFTVCMVIVNHAVT